MDIKKSYEFVSVGDKIIVRRMNASDTVFETVIVADALIEEKRMAKQNVTVFVLKSGNGWYLCIDDNNQLSVSPFCSEYCLKDNQVLYYGDRWCWCDMDGKKSVVLGQSVRNVSDLWVDCTENSGILSWFENETLQQKRFLTCKELAGYGIKELPLDLLKITTEEGEFFVSIRRHCTPNYNRPRFMGKARAKPVTVRTEVLFRKKSFSNEIEFYKFAQLQCEKLLATGLERIVSLYDDVLGNYIYDGSDKDCIVEYAARLKHLSDHDVTIYVNLSKLFRKEKGAYDVRCPELSYQRTVDEIEFGQDKYERALWIDTGDELEKLYAEAAWFKAKQLYYKRL